MSNYNNIPSEKTSNNTAETGCGTGLSGEGVVATVEVYGSGRLASVNFHGCASRGGGIRNKITEFSAKSRLRLIKSLMKLDKKHEPLFVTLTYPDEWKGFDFKGNLMSFKKRFSRTFPAGRFIWKLEYQKRGAPHFHLLVYGVPFEHLIYWVKINWYEVVGSSDEKHLRAGTRVEKRRSKNLSAYMCKYITKFETEKVQELVETGMISTSAIGRFWGKCGNVISLMSDCTKLVVPLAVAFDLKRVFRRIAKTKSKIGSVFLEYPDQVIRLVALFADNRGLLQYSY